jgi:hypothetical protein
MGYARPLGQTITRQLILRARAGSTACNAQVPAEAGIVLNGKLTHRRTINSKYGTSTIGWLHEHVDSCARRVEGKPKFKYLLPLDDGIAERVNSLAKAYPKIRATSDTSDTPGVHPGEGRAARTVALQSMIRSD